MKRLLVAALLAYAALAGPAYADGVSVIEIGGDATAQRQLGANVRLTGGLTIDFAGDPAAGCAQVGNCDVGGVITWNPQTTSGTLIAVQHRQRGVLHTGGLLILDGPFGPASPALASVHRAGGAVCSDAALSSSLVDIPDTRGRTLNVTLSGGEWPFDWLDTRCAGPLLDDVAAALPSAAIRFGDIRRGARLSLAGTHPFSAAGLSGTVRSTLALRVSGARRVQRLSKAPRPRRLRKRRLRVAFATYRIDQIAGTLGIDYTGVGDLDRCRPLDACGIAGTLTLTPRVHSGTLAVIASAPAGRPRRDLRAAMGLVPGGHPSGVQMRVYGEWRGPGEVTADVRRDGVPACADSAPLQGGLLYGSRHGGRVRLRYSTGAGSPSPRTRCPAPLVSAGDDLMTLAAGSVPLRAFGDPVTALRLTRGGKLSDDGYDVVTSAGLAFGIERLRYRERVYTDYDYGY